MLWSEEKVCEESWRTCWDNIDNQTRRDGDSPGRYEISAHWDWWIGWIEKGVG